MSLGSLSRADEAERESLQGLQTVQVNVILDAT